MKRTEISYRAKKFWRIIRKKYRFSISNESTLEEWFAIRLTPISIFLVAVFASFFIILLTSYVLLFTPLKAYMPGFVDTKTRNSIVNNAMKLDSLSVLLAVQSDYIRNIQMIVKGEIAPDTLTSLDTLLTTVNVDTLSASLKTKQFMENFEEEEKYNLSIRATHIPVDGLFFYKPVQTAVISKHFDYAHSHYGIDLMTNDKGAVLATLEGTVTLCSSGEYGHIIQIQHNNNFISVYKHTARLLKREGDKVKAGEAIAIVKDNSGEDEQGAHLHFELWYKGTPLNPEEYIIF